MSANNLLYIKESNKRISLQMLDAESGVGLGKKQFFVSLREAIRAANEIQDAEEVEYGLQIDLIEQL